MQKDGYQETFGEFRIKSMKSVGDQELLNMLNHFSIWEEQRRVS